MTEWWETIIWPEGTVTASTSENADRGESLDTTRALDPMLTPYAPVLTPYAFTKQHDLSLATVPRTAISGSVRTQRGAKVKGGSS